ncbi:hypothetical protein FC18_GL001907 [Lacticaseibacillus sharpeae JCM 1186 = DSM 20505]|uniref:DUF2335 domain-containing protein n=1 Tax=Lacticaseibacillus sharpeae JCM 1186 = DSM 20505 TaxID=1291052 RepID=A0A0R1ZIN9_9LACO|nr:hypothetical protein FC18_GL001907 [Lacticaseibacillus sharpeae JCM 1186 = DSM 20505]
MVQAEVAQLNGSDAGETLGERRTTKRAVSFATGAHFVVRKVVPDAQPGADLSPEHVNSRRKDILADDSAVDRPVYDPDLPPAEDFAYAATRTAAVGVSSQQVQVAAQSVRGPLPAAAELNAYNRAAPNAADRIIKMAEQQASHRQRLERAQVVATIRDQYLGLVLGFLVCIAGIVAGAYVAVNGAPLTGSALSFGALASLVGTFVYGSRK